MMSLVCAAVIGVANPCQPSHCPTSPGHHYHHGHQRAASAPQARQAATYLSASLASSRCASASIRYLLTWRSLRILSQRCRYRHPRRNGHAERSRKPVINKETVVKNTITTAYARVDRPVTKRPSPFPDQGETEMRANTAITRPLSPRSDGAVQQVSAPGGLRDLIRGAEEPKAREAERRADRNDKDPLCPGRRQRRHGLRQEKCQADVRAKENPRQIRQGGGGRQCLSQPCP